MAWFMKNLSMIRTREDQIMK